MADPAAVLRAQSGRWRRPFGVPRTAQRVREPRRRQRHRVRRAARELRPADRAGDLPWRAGLRHRQLRPRRPWRARRHGRRPGHRRAPGDRPRGRRRGVEILEGSNFADTLFGSNADNILRGLHGDDTLGGGLGADVIDEGTAANGADTINGGDGPNDTVFYRRRTSGVVVDLNGVRNDGAPGEQDDVRPSIEHIQGTEFRDTLVGNGSANRISGFGDVDTIDGLGGNDTLLAGAAGNNMFGGTGNDVIETRNGVGDNIDCGENAGDSDTANRDVNENRVTGCERGTVGVLRLTPRTTAARAGATMRLRLSWRLPVAWRTLRPEPPKALSAAQYGRLLREAKAHSRRPTHRDA